MLDHGLVATIRIGMSPNIVSAGSLTITWHSVFMVIATIAGVWLAIKWGREARLRDEIVPSVALWAVVGGLIGARALNVVDDWRFYKEDPVQILRIWEGGIAIFGAFVGGIIGGMIYAVANKYPIRFLLDIGGPAMVLGQAIGRIGDIINGEHFSTQTGLPWAVVYTHPDSPGFGRPPTHPAVAYELLVDLALFAILVWLRGRIRPQGALFALAAAAYGGVRWGFSYIRLDSASSIAGLNQQGFIGLVVLIAAGLALLYLRPRLGERDVRGPERYAEGVARRTLTT